MLLPLIGIYLRIRNEWLAAFGLAQMSAAAGLIGYGFGVPIVIAGPIGASLIALIKYFSSANNTAYALMILAGWGITFIVAANTALGESLGHALIDGQLYFAKTIHATTGIVLLALGALFLWHHSANLLRAQFFPHHEQLNETNRFRWHLGFDILVALSMGIATASLGLMTAFAMAFISPWVAFQIAASWRDTAIIATLFNLIAFLFGFALAIVFDQPYGPTQVLVHLVFAGLVLGLTKAFAFKALAKKGVKQ